jgi:hypothetical protein
MRRDPPVRIVLYIWHLVIVNTKHYITIHKATIHAGNRLAACLHCLMQMKCCYLHLFDHNLPTTLCKSIAPRIIFCIMGMNRTINYCAAWMGCFVILLASMAPSISRVLIAFDTHAPSIIEICTMDGMVQITDDTAPYPTSAATQQVMHIEHCPFCLNNPLALGLTPAAPVSTQPVLSSYYQFPALFYQASTPLFAWLSAQPRAPPVLA